MTIRERALFGPAGALLLLVGVVWLGAQVPGYDPVRQTVSEIGEVGSPMRLPFTVLLVLTGGCVLVFATALGGYAREIGKSRLAALACAWMGVAAAGVGVFSFPHPLHNVFGISELVGYQAPLAAALTLRGTPKTWPLVAFSWVMMGLVEVALALNLVPIVRPPSIWSYIQPVLGVVQRSLFAAWFAWCAGAGLMLWRGLAGPAEADGKDASPH